MNRRALFAILAILLAIAAMPPRAAASCATHSTKATLSAVCCCPSTAAMPGACAMSCHGDETPSSVLDHSATLTAPALHAGLALASAAGPGARPLLDALSGSLLATVSSSHPQKRYLLSCALRL